MLKSLSRLLLLFGVLGMLSAGCGSDFVRELRGKYQPSKDGQTYLVVDDDNGGQACEAITVDGQPWPHALHAKGAISPGTHTIECGGAVEVTINKGVTYHLSYWGP